MTSVRRRTLDEVMDDKQKKLPITKIFIHTSEGIRGSKEHTDAIVGKTLIVTCGGRKARKLQKFCNIVEVFDEDTGFTFDVNIGEGGNAVLAEGSSIRNIHFKDPIFVGQATFRQYARRSR